MDWRAWCRRQTCKGERRRLVEIDADMLDRVEIVIGRENVEELLSPEHAQ